MKRAVAIILSVLFVVSVFAIGASAATKDPVISPEKVVKIISGVQGDSNGGNVTPPTNTYKPGEDVTFYITPNAGYRIKQVWVNGVAIGPVSEYTFYNIQKDSTIYAEFEPDESPTRTTTHPATTNGGKTSPDTGSTNMGTLVLSVLGVVCIGSAAAITVAKKGRKEEN